MMFTKDCTVYIKTGEVQYRREFIEGVHWEDTKGANFNRTGVASVDSVFVAIPLEKIDLSDWGTANKDYIVKGECTAEVTDKDSLKAFLALKPHTITSVDKCDYSIVIGNHWEIGAR